MKQLITLIFTALLIMASVSAQTSEAAKVDPWTKYMMPDEVHRLLAQYDGEWTQEMSIWIEPGKPPVKAEVLTVNRMVMGGRYQESRNTGSVMGMPYEGSYQLGYNTITKKFTLTSVNNMGTGTFVVTGGWKVPQKSIELKGETNAPDTGAVINIRLVITMIDADNFLIENFDTSQGKTEAKTIEYRYKRKAKN